jgi:hypothetical protein
VADVDVETVVRALFAAAGTRANLSPGDPPPVMAWIGREPVWGDDRAL